MRSCRLLLRLMVMTVLDATNITVAGGTLVLALFTWRAARASQQAAKAGQLAAEATQQAAQASRDEADATIQLAREAREDRELAWRLHPEGMFDPPGNRRHRSKCVCLATCTDVLANHWRFVDGHPAEIVRPDDPDPPPWMRWVR
jgi:hypothetical protein